MFWEDNDATTLVFSFFPLETAFGNHKKRFAVLALQNLTLHQKLKPKFFLPDPNNLPTFPLKWE